MVLSSVLVGEVDVDCVLTLIGLDAVAYTMGSAALNVRSSIVQHVVLMGACELQSLKLPPTYAQHHDSGCKQFIIRPVFLSGSELVSLKIQDTNQFRHSPMGAQYFGHAGSFQLLSVQPVRQYQFLRSTSSFFIHMPFVRHRSPIAQHVECPPASTAVMLHGTCTLSSHVVCRPTVL